MEEVRLQMRPDELAAKAAAFAKAAHADQKRMYTGQPYHTHPQAVAALVEAVGFPPDVVAAAHLHDVLEDTPVSYTELAGAFGSTVAQLVMEVTKPALINGKPRKECGLNRAQRGQLSNQHFGQASYRGKSIKLADMIHNFGRFEAVIAGSPNPDYPAMYLAEAQQLLELLKGGHHLLFKKAKVTLARAEGLLVADKVRKTA